MVPTRLSEMNGPQPEIRYGIIASGNTLIKDAATRDKFVEAT
ncbi:hypothetical protein FOPG_15825 [Fusarium oxysporum f. sp. conglutinans race 2 54008]|uniref:Uncharacterized protein n=1 Tax=Fusarium oxysporum f. sp. conglutinans race 2 54008 TaxID=1089457 RepID=X0H875_FUSOX|nr:hypothetical protein FOPG_15825 [Fusarium oxysporum f. sp. conglutinans race 2 54008]